MWEIWGNLLLPKALKSCPKSNKLSNLVTLFRQKLCRSRVKAKLFEMMQMDRDFSREDEERLNPTHQVQQVHLLFEESFKLQNVHSSNQSALIWAGIVFKMVQPRPLFVYFCSLWQ